MTTITATGAAPTSPQNLSLDAATLTALNSFGAATLDPAGRAHADALKAVADVPTTRTTLKTGDTFTTLAEHYGTTREQLHLLNPRPEGTGFRAGESIRVPTNRDVAAFQSGDTLTQLGQTYGLTPQQMQRGNGIQNANVIFAGDRFAAVPATEFGLGTDKSINSYIKAVQPLQADWPSLTPGERLNRLETALNRELIASGVPRTEVVGGVSDPANTGEYDPTTHQIGVRHSMLTSPTITTAELKELADTVYHEGRHAEQEFDVARVAIARGVDPHNSVAPSLVAAARAAPAIDLNSETGRFVEAMYESSYGTGEIHRDNVYNGTTPDPDEDYYRLPEEADAWRVGGKVLNLWPR